MNRLCDVEICSNESAIRSGTSGQTHFQMAQTIHVLSVGPVDCGSMVHDALFDRASFRLTIATDYRELWGIAAQESIHVGVLHDAFSSFELEAACRLIRQRWPHAKILLVSRQESSLDDGLYDDRALTAAPDLLGTTIERLAVGWLDWPQVSFRIPSGIQRHKHSLVPTRR
jgi:hypothetical protein